MLESPSANCEVKGNTLFVSVRFKSDSGEESGRIWWMYDRGLDGSAAHINEMIPDDQWKDMKYDAQKKVWSAEEDLETDASHIDFFSNYRKTLRYQSNAYPTYPPLVDSACRHCAKAKRHLPILTFLF